MGFLVYIFRLAIAVYYIMHFSCTFFFPILSMTQTWAYLYTIEYLLKKCIWESVCKQVMQKSVSERDVKVDRLGAF